MSKAIELLKSINTDKLRILADWLDIKDLEDSCDGVEVQLDLRRWARIIDQALTELTKRPDLEALNKQLLEACKAFVVAHEKSLQLEKTDVALNLAKTAIEVAESQP